MYLGAAKHVGGASGETRLRHTRMQVVEDNGRSDPMIGIVALTYAVTYRTDRVAQPPLDDFLSVDAKHRIVGAVEANQGRDIFVVQETPP
mgnify:FL=1